MCRKDASVSNIAVIRENSKNGYIPADIHDNCIHSFIWVIY